MSDEISLEDLVSDGGRWRDGGGSQRSRPLLACGNDSTPLVSLVPDAPPSHWGVVLTDRRKSDAYEKFRRSARDRHKKKG